MPNNTLYFDNSTTARPSALSISKLLPFMNDLWGIPSTPHIKGEELHSALSESYRTLYEFLGAKQGDQFVFTSSGTEAINHVILSIYRDVTYSTGKNQFLTCATDEAPAILATERLSQFGCVAKTIPVNAEGKVTPHALVEAISPRTALVSLSWANGLTGVIQPVAELADLCRERGILLHLDATHVLGKLFFQLEDIGADFITFNGDQIHAPKGTGGLWIREGIRCSPFIFGGNDQAGLRAGAVNVGNLVALATAANEAIDSRDLLCSEVSRLRNKLEEEIQKGIPQATIFFKKQERLPHCTVIGFPGIVNEALLFLLNRKGLCASIGGGNFLQLTHQLKVCGISFNLAQGAIAFTLSRYTTEEEVNRAIEVVCESVNLLLKMTAQMSELFENIP